MTPDEVATRTTGLVASVRTPEGAGSAFFIAPDLIVTCYHVVEGNGSVAVASSTYSGQAVEAVAWSPDDDIAVLRVAPPADGAGLELSTETPGVGTKVLVVSSPLGLENSISDGLLSGIRGDHRSWLQFTAPISPGSSGGPLLDTRGRVLGVVSNTLTALEEGRTYGQNLNFAVPSPAVNAVLQHRRNTTMAKFAASTETPEKRHWRETEAQLPEIERRLHRELGEAVGKAYAAEIRHAIEERNADLLAELNEGVPELQEMRTLVLRVSAQLLQMGPTGLELSGDLKAAWEKFGIHRTEQTNAEFLSVLGRARRHTEANMRRMSLPGFPNAFAGFPFNSSVKDVYRFCYPGYTSDPVPGLAKLDCPTSPVPPPFASGPATLEFLNGRLAAVIAPVNSYSKTVAAIADRYGQPYFQVFSAEGWQRAKMPSPPSYRTNTSYNWTLDGGRIRVGRTRGDPFVAFVHADRDAAINNSY